MIQATTLAEQRAHKAVLLRNLRAADRNCAEHATLLRQVFAPLLTLRLPRQATKPIKRLKLSGNWHYPPSYET
jgi:hypothetical protein